jgi:hypothetical protein
MYARCPSGHHVPSGSAAAEKHIPLRWEETSGMVYPLSAPTGLLKELKIGFRVLRSERHSRFQYGNVGTTTGCVKLVVICTKLVVICAKFVVICVKLVGTCDKLVICVKLVVICDKLVVICVKLIEICAKLVVI